MGTVEVSLMPFAHHVGLVPSQLQLVCYGGYVDVQAQLNPIVYVILVGVMWPPPSEERNSRWGAVFENIMAIQQELIGHQVIKVWCQYGWIAKAYISIAPVIHQHKHNVWLSCSSYS